MAPTFDFHSEGIAVVQALQDHVKGKTIVITGPSAGGLGAETAISLAHGSPAHILLLGRSETKIKPVITKIRKIDSNVTAEFLQIQLDDNDSVREAADQISSKVSKLDILINCAGIMAVKDYTTNKAGIESQLAANHVGHFLLTNLLMPKILAAGQGARIVSVTSDGYQICPFRFDDWNFSDGKTYDPWSGYGQSKTANILFTRYLAARLAPKGVRAYAVHPGVIFGTSLGTHVDEEDFSQIEAIAKKNTGQGFEVGTPKSLQQGVSTTLVAAFDPRLNEHSGSYLENCAVKEAREYATSRENAEKLWELSEGLFGEKFDL